MADKGEQEARDFTAAEVRKATGLTSRQLNDWDERGALPHERKVDGGWRRFSRTEIFALAVCAEMRSRLGIPVERLKFVRESMLEDGDHQLVGAVELVARLGVNIWILTDFETTFIMDSELEFMDLMSAGLLSGEKDSAFVLLKVTPLINNVLASLKNPINLPLHGRGYELVREIRTALSVKTPDEMELLELVRGGDYTRIEVRAKDGTIERIKKSKRVDPSRRVEELLEEHDYQRITVVQQDGRVVMLEQELSDKR